MLWAVIGLLYDVHGNLPALEAVLDDARGLGVGRWIVGGDVVLFGAWPAETVARLRELADADWLRGNTDRWLVDDSDRPPVATAATEDCVGALDDATVRELAGLPFDIGAPDALYVHASAASDMRSFLPEPTDDEPELLEAIPAGTRRLVFGHTHLPFARTAGDVELVNPGSVGMPLDGDHRAAWAVVHDDGRVEHRRVAYDHERSAGALAERFGEKDWTAALAARVRAARMVAT
jgi:diadenosine tetraphosphatase ApaH/serine/threonine PP2A family protein phosphatase